jgi:hypothetical protein
LLPVLRLIQLGELAPSMFALRLGGAALVGPVYDNYARYKLEQANRLRPRLLVLGSSRTMQLRETAFSACRPPSPPERACFYNAGGALPSLGTGLLFLRGLRDDAWPAVLLLGVDYWHMHPPLRDGSTDAHAALREQELRPLGAVQQLDVELAPAVTSLTTALQSPTLRLALVSPAPLARLDGLRPVGLAAYAVGAGFRPDGSYSYGPEAEMKLRTESAEDWRRRLDEALERARVGCCLLAPFDAPHPRALQDLEDLLTLARRHGTVVVGFTPPLANEVADALSTDPRQRGGWLASHAALETAFARLGMPFVPFAALADAGCGPLDFYDGLHPTAPCMENVIERLVERSADAERALRPFVAAG